jgi:hypothetical protein
MTPPFYTPGVWAAGTPGDEEAMTAAAIPCWLFRLREFGMRLPVPSIPEPMQGNVLCIDRYEEQTRFYMRFYRAGRWAHWHLEMHGARLVKERGGVWQFSGDEWNSEVKQHYLQTWLCTPTAERGRDILAQMALS